MIKGILLKHSPKMKEISEIEILSQLDPLNEYDQLSTRVDPISGYTIYRRSYYSDNLYITSYSSEGKSVIDSIWEVYETLNYGAPNFIKSFRKDQNMIIVSWPRYEDDKFEDASYTLMIEELTRFTAFSNIFKYYFAFILKNFSGSAESLSVYLKEYINMCIVVDEEND